MFKNSSKFLLSAIGCTCRPTMNRPIPCLSGFEQHSSRIASTGTNESNLSLFSRWQTSSTWWYQSASLWRSIDGQITILEIHRKDRSSSRVHHRPRCVSRRSDCLRSTQCCDSRMDIGSGCTRLGEIDRIFCPSRRSNSVLGWSWCLPDWWIRQGQASTPSFFVSETFDSF